MKEIFCGFQVLEALKLQTQCLVARITLKVDDVVIPIVAARIDRTIFMADHF